MKNIFNFGGSLRVTNTDNDDTKVRTMKIDGKKIFINDVEVPLEIIQDGTTIKIVVGESVGSIHCDRDITVSVVGNVGSLNCENDVHADIRGTVGSMHVGRDMIGRHRK